MIIHNLQDLCTLLCADTPDQLQKQVYKYTECGGNMAFRVRKDLEPDKGFWHYDVPSKLYPGWDVIGVKLTSIVEGSDAIYDGDALLFPFTEDAYRTEEARMEIFCDREWTRANHESHLGTYREAP